MESRDGNHTIEIQRGFQSRSRGAESATWREPSADCARTWDQRGHALPLGERKEGHERCGETRRGGGRARRDHSAQVSAGSSDGGARLPKKSGGLLRERETVRYQCIRAEKANHSILMMCRALKVSRSG